MIIDTSAVVAIMRRETDWVHFERAIDESFERFMSASSVLELSIVLRGAADPEIDNFIETMNIEILDVDSSHLRWARHANRAYGRHSGSPAKLNFGDCLVYGAAMSTGKPLLFKGDDFGHTDVPSVL
ncbi:MAG TPA: type II toxin-antitoxin system VapC family toxin [Dietzia timorensis]|uniref:Ribonuclease VapC n=1 Tax=Dietzia timorensis TaxID=499555 RepID=A0A921JX91_9ACTN|nr:type II toxin-antitoxin system VapC family toxin [Dietzia timorensis]HJE89583.1 type II toxin-antitoxin system VapC family toxin [Dietzia timorensis]